MLALGRKIYTHWENTLKSRDISLPTKVHLAKAMAFPVVIFGCESWIIKKAECCSLILLNCCVGEDSWESPGLQGDPTSPSLRKSVLNIHWKDWCWSWNSNTLATYVKNWLIGKHPDAGKDWGQEEKGTTEDEMVRWHHRLDGHGFGWTPGVGDGLVCWDSWGCKELDMTEQLNWTEHWEIR